MNEVLQAIEARRSVRSFTSDSLSRELLEQIAQAGQYAPTARDTRTRLLTVVQQPEKIAALCEAMALALPDKDYCMYHPSAIIIVSELRSETQSDLNCACAMQNMMLAAHSLDVGCVWINQLRIVCNDYKVLEVLDSLGIPADHRAVCNLALGHIKTPAAPKDKSDLAIHWCL